MPQLSPKAPPRHFLDLCDVPAATLQRLITRALELKHRPEPVLKGKILAMIYEKPSTRTRLSFDVAMQQLGGSAITLNPSDMQLGRGETIEDTAKVMSRYVNAVMIRTTAHDRLQAFAAVASVPVINGLTDKSHPCQIMADILTIQERFGRVEGLTVAWFGDVNNVCWSWAHAAAAFGCTLRIAAPPALCPPVTAPNVVMMDDANEAARGADVIVTDVWASMGRQRTEAELEQFIPYRVTADIMALAKPEAIFLHCLPAVRGMEVTAEVLDDKRAAVWDEAENRLHAQKAILEYCLVA
jgi:ornithine carbamoyltransferase